MPYLNFGFQLGVRNDYVLFLLLFDWLGFFKRPFNPGILAGDGAHGLARFPGTRCLVPEYRLEG
jgi:hypothetical protein